MGKGVLKMGLAGLVIAGFAGCTGTTYKHRNALVRDGAVDTQTDGRDAMPVDTRPADGTVRDADPRDAARLDAADTRPSLEALLIRGEYLVKHVSACGDCHTPVLPSGLRDGSKYLAGNADFMVRPDGTRLPSRNLTPHASGLGARSAAEIKQMFLDGRDGSQALNPVMPYYVFHNITADDADAIVVYLRSVPGVDNSVPGRSADFDVSDPAVPLAMAKVPAPTGADKDSAIRGRYLATQTGLCIECHTLHTNDLSLALDRTRFFQGGEDFSSFVTSLGIHPVAANLTSDRDTGLGRWTINDIVTVLKSGKDKDGNSLCPPMPVGPSGAFGGLTQADATDIANYIKSIPAASNVVAGTCTWPPTNPPTTDTNTSTGTN
jgi:mono/diheme cytochrome c family protein